MTEQGNKMSMKLLVVLAFTLTVTLANVIPNKSSPQGRITFGDWRSDTYFNYQVGLAIGVPGQPVAERKLQCGGSIIAKNWVLTACHCVWGFYNLHLHFGSHDFNNPQLSIEVSYNDIIMHDRYDPRNLNNDIALIRTSTNIPISEDPSSFYGKVTLPPKGTDDSYLDQIVIVAGWGQTESMPSSLPYIRYGDMQVISNEKCLETFNIVTDKTLCASPLNYVSTCFGDSGGPIVLTGKNATERIQVGVTSFVTLAGCTLGKPAGFVRITEYLDWIEHYTGVVY